MFSGEIRCNASNTSVPLNIISFIEYILYVLIRKNIKAFFLNMYLKRFANFLGHTLEFFLIIFLYFMKIYVKEQT